MNHVIKCLKMIMRKKTNIKVQLMKKYTLFFTSMRQSFRFYGHVIWDSFFHSYSQLFQLYFISFAFALFPSSRLLCDLIGLRFKIHIYLAEIYLFTVLICWDFQYEVEQMSVEQVIWPCQCSLAPWECCYWNQPNCTYSRSTKDQIESNQGNFQQQKRASHYFSPDFNFL